MKKSILVLLTAFGINAVVAQTNVMSPNTSNVPSTVTNKFNTDNPNVKADWQTEGDHYTAQYMDETNHMNKTVVYDKSGNVVRTDMEINKSTYPATITDYYTKNYPTEEYKVWSSIDNNGNTTYYTKRKSETLWFDKNGSYVSTTTPGKTTKTTKTASGK